MILHRVAVKIGFFLNGFIFANWASRLPGLQEVYHADNGTIGLVLLASSVGAVGAMPFTGWAIIKNGSRKIMLIALLAYCAVVPLFPIMQTVPALMAIFFLEGIITGMLDVAMNSQAVMVEQKYQKPIMTSFHALFSIGMALGAWCGALFTDLTITLATHFLIISGVSLVAAAWASRNLIFDKPDPGLKHDGPLFRLPSASLIGIGIITFCCMLGEGAMSNWSVNFMQNISLASETLAPLGLSAFATAMTIGRLFGDRVRASFGDRNMIIGGGTIAAIGLLVALTFVNPYITIGGFFFVGIGLSTIVPIAYSIAGNAKDLSPGVGLAMVTTVGYSGFLVGPPIIGFVSDWQGLRVALAMVCLLFVVMTFLGIRYSKKD